MTLSDAGGPEAGEAALAGVRVLVVEDETIVAMLIEDILGDLGAVVVGPATRVARAFDLIAAEPVDVALLDLNLAGETTVAVAHELRRRGIPFAFATGYGAGGLPDGFEGQALLAKPFHEGDLRQALLAALALSPGAGR